jgi:hypothetical protein
MSACSVETLEHTGTISEQKFLPKAQHLHVVYLPVSVAI